MIYTAFNRTMKVKNDSGDFWKTETVYFQGDLTKDKIDFNADWRFCKVENKREKLQLIGLVDKFNF